MKWTLEMRTYPKGTCVRWVRQPITFDQRSDAVQWLREYTERHPDESIDSWRIRRVATTQQVAA